MADTEAMRRRIEQWLSAKIPNVSALRVAPLEIPKGAGSSAETIYVDIDYQSGDCTHSKQLVLRRQNEGSDLFLGASIEGPWQMMKALGEHTDIPVPALFGLELDRAVFERPFMVMEKIDGRVAAQSPNYNVEGWLVDLPPAQRGTVWRNGLQSMARVHALDWRRGFEFLNKPASGEPGLPQFLAWMQEWYEWAKAGRAQPVLDVAMRHLLEKMPRNATVSVLWGDGQPSNILFRDDGSVAALLDWETAMLGPAEIDLSWWLFCDALFSSGMGVTRAEGLPTRDETIAVYETLVGRALQNMDYYDLMSMMRMAIISIRTFDRYRALGKVREGSNAITHNPMTAMVARHLGLPVPEVGPDFFELVRANFER